LAPAVQFADPTIMSDAEKPTVAVILAAGKGTRIKADVPKALLPLCGRPLVSHVIQAAREAGVDRVLVVVGHAAEQVAAAVGPECACVLQEEQLGSAHALGVCGGDLAHYQGTVLALYCDVPLLGADLLRDLIAHHRETGAAATLLSVVLDDPGAYGRILRAPDGRVLGIVEARDASPEQRAIREINVGVYCFEAPLIFQVLGEVQPDNVKSEHYLTDAIGLLADRGERVAALTTTDTEAIAGVNTLEELAAAERTLLERKGGAEPCKR
jgi:bifunctional UDP-N-acetylglucosamine pyrophosphorylase/glucosamine-1-phosphate N-acetyltransferase